MRAVSYRSIKTTKPPVPHIYAAGDVDRLARTGRRRLRPGPLCRIPYVRHEDQYRVEDVATGIWTIPEISFVGKNES